LGGPQPYVPVGIEDDNSTDNINNYADSGIYQRARVLCSYDAKDGTELNLNANEVIN
jgi:endophilin-B1